MPASQTAKIRKKKIPASRKPISLRQRILIEFPKPLLDRTEAAAEHLSTNRSQFIRQAVEQALSALEEQKLARQLADAYAANSSLALQIADEFSNLDSEDFAWPK